MYSPAFPVWLHSYNPLVLADHENLSIDFTINLNIMGTQITMASKTLNSGSHCIICIIYRTNSTDYFVVISEDILGNTDITPENSDIGLV